MYCRHSRPNCTGTKEQNSLGTKNHIWTLIGVTGIRNVRPEPTWIEAVVAPIDVAWRPHMFLILLFEGSKNGHNPDDIKLNTSSDSSFRIRYWYQRNLLRLYPASSLELIFGEAR